MFARRLRVEIEQQGSPRACPLDWMDHFFMRHFTGISALDDTLPVSDGLLEAGRRVDLAVLTASFEQWLKGRKLIPLEARLLIHEA